MGHHRFKVTLEVTMVDPKEPPGPDGPADPVVTAELTKQMKNLKAKKGAAEYTVQQVDTVR